MKINLKDIHTQFIHDQEFISWILNPTAESDLYWDNFILDNPSQKKDIAQSRVLIKSLVRNNKQLSGDEVSALWDRISKTNRSRKSLKNSILRWSVAASILMIVGLSGWWLSVTEKTKIDVANYQSIAINKSPGNDIKLILSDQTEKTFTTKEVDLKYNQKGQLETRSGKITETEDIQNDTNTLQMNQLVVPRGKRSSIELSDGSKLWLNSGSTAIFPVAFNQKYREIFIEGEGYLEVAHDAEKPFIVVTEKIKVEVLGTKFDISAYKEDNVASVVLVEGSIKAYTGNASSVLVPDQKLSYEVNSGKSRIEKTDVLEYTAWKDGWMLCNKEQIQSITTKLSRYYDVKIYYSDLRLNAMTLTGKLDLKSNCEDVLKVICATAPLNYEMIDNAIYLKMKE